VVRLARARNSGGRGIAGRISDTRREDEEQRTEEGIEALVEAAEEEGIIEPEQADLIEQVGIQRQGACVKLMTPARRYSCAAADARSRTACESGRDEIKKIPVYEKSLDDIFGVVYSQDLLPNRRPGLLKRKVRELVKPVLSYRKRNWFGVAAGKCGQKGQPLL